jgi:hypothetical protein
MAISLVAWHLALNKISGAMVLKFHKASPRTCGDGRPRCYIWPTPWTWLRRLPLARMRATSTPVPTRLSSRDAF